MSDEQPETIVCGVMARPRSLTMFADISGAAVRFSQADGETCIHFDAELTTEQVDAVWWRMTSRSDADEARRRALAAALEAEGVDPLVADLARYVLGLGEVEDESDEQEG